MSRTKMLILKLLADRGEPMSPIEIAEATKLEHDNVRQTLRRMVMSGDIKSEFGKYRHSDVASPSGGDNEYAHDAVRQCLWKLQRERIDDEMVAWAAMVQGAWLLYSRLGGEETKEALEQLLGLILVRMDDEADAKREREMYGE